MDFHTSHIIPSVQETETFLDWEGVGHMPVQRLLYGSFSKTEQHRCLCYHISLVKSVSFKKGFAISSSVSHQSCFSFSVCCVICWPFPALQRTIQHNISTKCQGYTTDLIVCYWHHTSLSILVIQSNTVPNVNWREKKKKKKTNKQTTTHHHTQRKENRSDSTGTEIWRELDKEEQTFFTEEERLLSPAKF